MKKTKRYSLIKITSISLIVVFLLVFLLVITNNITTITAAKEKISEGIYEALSVYNTNLHREISTVESYLASKAYDNSASNLRIIERNVRNVDYFKAVAKEKYELESMVSTLEIVEGIFEIPKESNVFVYSDKENNYTTTGVFRDYLRKAIKDDTVDELVKSKWSVFYCGDKGYFLRVLNIGKSYVGAWVSFSTMLSSINDHRALVEKALFIDSNEYSYDISSVKELLSNPINSQEAYTTTTIEGERKILISISSDYINSGSYISMVVPEKNVSVLLAQNYITIIVTLSLLLIISLITIFFFHKYSTKPMQNLVTSINSLRSGDFSTRIDGGSIFSEFDDINKAFNDMVGRIQNLKINVYEEQLINEKIENKFLKTQIAPHFLINCLNLIYHLAETGEKDKVQAMTVSLGNHLRYALSEKSEVTVKEELDMVKNYIELSKLRFPGSIKEFTEVDSDLLNMPILPMSIIVFVENTIKYEVVAGQVTEIHIEVTKFTEGTDTFARINIWDTGEGYGEELLKIWNNGENLSGEYGNYIGIRNLNRRLKLIYGDNVVMKFYNHPNAGANAELIVPLFTDKKGGLNSSGPERI